jgi:hypothetical protein
MHVGFWWESQREIEIYKSLDVGDNSQMNFKYFLGGMD